MDIGGEREVRLSGCKSILDFEKGRSSSAASIIEQPSIPIYKYSIIAILCYSQNKL